MRLVILGAGAIGGVLGGLLARANRDVILIARGAQLAAIRERGLRVERPDETFVVQPPVVDPRDGASLDWRRDDVVVLAVKTQDVAAALDELAAPAHVPIACFTNGVEAERIALRRAVTVIGASVVMPSTYVTPGAVQAWFAPAPGVIELGRYPDGIVDVAHELAGELAVAGLIADVRANVMAWKRRKLIVNLGNAVDALVGPGAGESALVAAARAEGHACLTAAGLSCTSDRDASARYGGYDIAPIAGADRSGGSTWQSLARGAHVLETAYLNGEIAMLGRIHGVPTPINAALQRIATDAARIGAAAGAMTLADLEARVQQLSDHERE